MHKGLIIPMILAIIETISIIVYATIFKDYWFLFAILSVVIIFSSIVPNANMIQGSILIILNSIIGYFILESFILYAFATYLLWFLNCGLLGVALLEEEE